ncbi:MAG: 5-oxopent-3-ene-1,2,5-tricarboxylate decarboxylase [Oceanospirillaceae bacterium]|jgi:5-oxopent-3-ene-1,2,5-tricarboxylate decarboxylase/2-hydroxyhepta-2,4-diene-1,7-dioate isomerase
MPLLDIQFQQQTLFEVMQTNNSAVYGVVLNDHDSLAALASQLDHAPYKAAPIAPVLYIKPKNTFTANNTIITLPSEETSVEIGATLALVMKKRATCVATNEALSHIAGVGLVADLSLPHDSYYRPAIREKCFDGALAIGDKLVAIESLGDIENLAIEVQINGQLVATKSFTSLVRKADQLIVDVTDYMTLRAADVLLLTVSYQAEQATCDDKVSLTLIDTTTHQQQAHLSFEIQAGDCK